MDIIETRLPSEIFQFKRKKRTFQFWKNMLKSEFTVKSIRG